MAAGKKLEGDYFMPVYRFTVNDKEDGVCRSAANLTPFAFNDWLRQAVVSAGMAALAKAPAVKTPEDDEPAKPAKPAKPPKWSKGEVTEFRKTLAQCAEQNYDLAEYVALFADSHGTPSGKAYVAQLGEWARENGHLGE